MEIIGHRGAKGQANENTIDAFKIALDSKVDMIETDIRLQGKDLVLSHDATLPTGTYAKLSELLDLVKGTTVLNLEIKEKRTIPKLKKLLKSYKGKIVFSSFDFGILKNIKDEFPGHELAVLEKWSGVRAVAEASLLDTDRIHINQAWLWSNFVKSLDNRGFRLYAYTVNTVERANELKEWGVKGIFTDYPEKFKDYYK